MVRVISNLSVIGNFILKDLARRKGFPRTKKKDLYDLFIVDKGILLNKGRKVKKEIILL